MSIFRPRLPWVRDGIVEAGLFARDVLRYLKELTDQTLQLFSRTRHGFVPSPGPVSETPDYHTLRADGTWAAATGATLADGDYGDVTVSGGGANIQLDPDSVGTTEIQDAAVTFPKIENVADGSFLGRIGGGAGQVQNPKFGATFDTSGSDLERAALTGDVAAASGSNATTIAADAVTNPKLANMAEATIKGRAAGAGTGDPQDLTAAQVLTVLGISGAALARGKYAPGSFTLATGEYGFVTKSLIIAGAERATLEGTARLVLFA